MAKRAVHVPQWSLGQMTGAVSQPAAILAAQAVMFLEGMILMCLVVVEGNRRLGGEGRRTGSVAAGRGRAAWTRG